MTSSRFVLWPNRHRMREPKNLREGYLGYLGVPTVAQRVPAHPAAKPGRAIAHTKANGLVHPAVAANATFVIPCVATNARAEIISPTIMFLKKINPVACQ